MAATKKQYRNKFNGDEIVRWVADSKARRVPLFVIEKFGLKTKTEVVERFGYGAVFDRTEKGSAVLVQRGSQE